MNVSWRFNLVCPVVKAAKRSFCVSVKAVQNHLKSVNMVCFIFRFQTHSQSGNIIIAEQFEQQWNFPHCVRAMDGKHVIIWPPPNTGSYYFNNYYKHSFSIVLLAVVDADYKFTYVDVGCIGRISDGGVFKNSSLHPALEQNSIPSPKFF